MIPATLATSKKKRLECQTVSVLFLQYYALCIMQNTVNNQLDLPASVKKKEDVMGVS